MDGWPRVGSAAWRNRMGMDKSALHGCLCRSPEKRDALGALMQRLVDALARSGALPPPRGAKTGARPELAPQALQWALFYLAQHHDWLGDTGARARCTCFDVVGVHAFSSLRAMQQDPLQQVWSCLLLDMLIECQLQVLSIAAGVAAGWIEMQRCPRCLLQAQQDSRQTIFETLSALPDQARRWRRWTAAWTWRRRCRSCTRCRRVC